EPGRSEEHHHGEEKQNFHVGSSNQSAFAGQVEISLLAAFYLFDGFRKLFGQGYSHQNQTMITDRRSAQNVFGLFPSKRRRSLRFRTLQRKLGSQLRPGSG